MAPVTSSLPMLPESWEDVQIWNNPNGGTFRARFRKVEQAYPGEKADRILKQARTKEAKSEETDLAARIDALAPLLTPPVNVAELQASIVNLRAELADVRGQLDHKSLMLSRLERSKGIAAAQVIASVPTFGEHRDPLTTFNEMPDGPEKTAFYNENKAQLIAFIGKSDTKVVPYTR